MFLTNILLKKAKSKSIMVLMESVVSGHQVTRTRERLGEKLELKLFDPYIQHESLYKERKKIRSMKSNDGDNGMDGPSACKSIIKKTTQSSIPS